VGGGPLTKGKEWHVTHAPQRELLLDLHRRMVRIRRCGDEAGRLVGRIADLNADPNYLTDLAY